jgi:hypothetical protein
LFWEWTLPKSEVADKPNDNDWASLPMQLTRSDYSQRSASHQLPRKLNRFGPNVAEQVDDPAKNQLAGKPVSNLLLETCTEEGRWNWVDLRDVRGGD